MGPEWEQGLKGSAPLPKNAIVLTAQQELVLSDSKKVYSASNPAFHRGTTSILYRTLSSKQLPQNQHGVLRCPVSIQTPGSSVAAFSIHLPPDIHTQRHKRRHHKRCIFQPLSFLHLDIFFLHRKKGENCFFINGFDWNYYSRHTVFVVCIVHIAHVTWIFFMYENDADVQVWEW